MEQRMIPVPPIDAQLRFREEIGRIHQLQALQETAFLGKEALFGSLEQRAFRGEL
jgi:hypothetical protein